MYSLGDPQVFSFCLYVIGFIILPIHIFGAGCILFKTPNSMKTVKYQMLNLQFWAALLDLELSILFQPFICTPAVAGMPLGLLKKLSLKIAVYIGMTSFVFVCFSIVVIFENRYFLLFVKQSWWRHGRYWLLGFNYFVAAVYMVPTILSVPDQDLARAELFKNLPQLREYDTPESPIFVLAVDNFWINILQSSVALLLSSQIIIFMQLLRTNMKKQFKSTTASTRTMHMQKEFLRALNMQIFFPFLIVLFPAIILGVFGTFGVYNQAANNFIFLITSIHGAASTILMIYLQKPYRDFCTKLVHREGHSSRAS